MTAMSQTVKLQFFAGRSSGLSTCYQSINHSMNQSLLGLGVSNAHR